MNEGCQEPVGQPRDGILFLDDPLEALEQGGHHDGQRGISPQPDHGGGPKGPNQLEAFPKAYGENRQSLEFLHEIQVLESRAADGVVLESVPGQNGTFQAPTGSNKQDGAVWNPFANGKGHGDSWEEMPPRASSTEDEACRYHRDVSFASRRFEMFNRIPIPIRVTRRLEPP